MGATYKTPCITRPGQSVFIATPAYEQVKPGYAYALAATVSELTKCGIPFSLAIMYGNCHVDDGRNALVEDFLHETECTDLVFIDADVMWDADTFMRLIRHDQDLIAGAYPFKSFPYRYPIGKFLDEMTPDGLVSVSYAATGFMRIRRKVFETLYPGQPRCKTRARFFERTEVIEDSEERTQFFERRGSSRTYDGGDVTFCRKAIAAGFKCMVDTTLSLSHIGEWRWTGRFIDHIRDEDNLALHTYDSKDPVPEYKPDGSEQEKPKAQAQPVKGSPVGDPPEKETATWDAIEALKRGDPESAHFNILADAWGNKPWAATPEYLETAYKMACNVRKGGRILECGSGISTTVLALAVQHSGATLTVLDHSDEWQGKAQGWLEAVGALEGVVFPSPDIKREIGWYDYAPDAPPDLIIIDGPPHYMGTDRLYPLKQPWIGTAGVLLDDASSNALEQLRAIKGKWIPFKFGVRPGCIGRAGIDENWTVEQLSNSAA